MKNIEKQYFIPHNENEVRLLPFDSDEPICLSQNTFDKKVKYEPGDAALCNLIYYNGIWELNGFFIPIPIKEYEKNREEAKRNKENIEYSINLFLKANNNKPIRYLKNGKEYEDFFNEAFELKKKMSKNHFKGYENLVSFINYEYGVTTIADLAVYIKDKDNPCYNQKATEDHGLALFAKIELFKELIDYLIKNKCLSNISMNSLKGKTHGKQLVQKNLDFLFRFLQPLSYR
jgi:hypothetical protein